MKTPHPAGINLSLNLPDVTPPYDLAPTLLNTPFLQNQTTSFLPLSAPGLGKVGAGIMPKEATQRRKTVVPEETWRGSVDARDLTGVMGRYLPLCIGRVVGYVRRWSCGRG